MSQTDPLKPGYQTTEFWMAATSQILVLFGVLRVLPTQDVAVLQDAVAQCVLAVSLFLSNAWVVVRYIQGRTTLKQTI
jgi:hypothetical protein